MIRVGFDVAQTCVEKAGCAIYADALARALAEQDDVELSLYHHFGRWVNDSTESGVYIEKPNVTMPFVEMSKDEAAKFWSQSTAFSLPGSPDIVHANSFQAPQLKEGKLVMTIYDVSFWKFPEYGTELNRLACQSGVIEGLKRADGFIFISESARTEFEEMLPGWLEAQGMPWTVTLLGNRHSSSQRVPLDERRPQWLAVGSLEPRKNYDTMLKALSIYRAKSADPKPLVIIGGQGWLSAKLQRQLQNLQARGWVEWNGYLSDGDVAQAYSHSFGLLCSSWYEGFGLPVLEAMANGTPVITSERASLPEVGGNAVHYAQPDSPEIFAEAMLLLEKEPKAWQEKSEAGWRRAARFTWERTAAETVNFYRKLITCQASSRSSKSSP